MTTRELLITARDHLSDPSSWQKRGGTGPNGELCAALVLNRDPDDLLVSSATEALARAVGWSENTDKDPFTAVFRWNDDPATTHADVLAAFDRAIEATA